MKTRIQIGICLIFSMYLTELYGQIDYPDNTSNARFYTDYYSSKIVRPALSIRGFDSEAQWQNTVASEYGYGLKKIIGKSNQIEVELLLEDIVDESEAFFVNPSGSTKDKVSIINANARIVESKAFMALLGYVLEKNGLDYSAVGLVSTKTPRQYLDEVTNYLLNPSGGLLFGMELVQQTFDDTILGDVEPIHTLSSNMSIARTLDLYLAIENAYKYYESTSYVNSKLLTQSQKYTYSLRYIDRSVDEIYALVRESYAEGFK